MTTTTTTTPYAFNVVNLQFFLDYENAFGFDPNAITEFKKSIQNMLTYARFFDPPIVINDKAITITSSSVVDQTGIEITIVKLLLQM